MAKETMILAVSILTLFVAAFAAYSISGLEITSSPQTATAEIIDYTDEFQAIQSTLLEVTQKLETLETDTVKELEIIKTELENVKSITSETKQEIVETSEPFSITLNKSTYQKGEAIVVSSHNALAQKPVTVQLVSSFNELITSKNTFSDSTGGFVFTFPIPEFVSPGDYKIKVTSESGTDTMLISIIDDSTSEESTTQTVTSISAILDKEEYKSGDMVKITGIGLVSTPITAELTSPDNEKSSANASTASDGTYTLIFFLDSNAKQGDWKIKVTQEDLTQTVTFEVDN